MIRPIGIQTVLTLLFAMAMPVNAEPLEVVDEWIQEALANNATLGAQKSVAEAAEAEMEGSILGVVVNLDGQAGYGPVAIQSQ